MRFCFWSVVIFPWTVFTVTLSGKLKPLIDEELAQRHENHALQQFLRKDGSSQTSIKKNVPAESASPFKLTERPRVASFIPPELVAGYAAMNKSVPQWITTPKEVYASTPYLPLDKPAVKSQNMSTQLLPGPGVRAETERICAALEQANRTVLAKMFRQCFPNTLETTVQLLQPDRPDAPARAFLITGDIDLMWLRDSTAQVHQYLQLPSLHDDPTIVAVVQGVIQQQMWFIRYDPYGSSFRLDFRPNPPSDDGMDRIHVLKARNAHVAMHNFELDSLCYPIWLSYEWWIKTKRTGIFTREWVEAAWLILDVFRREQRHFLEADRLTSQRDCRDLTTSCYRYSELRGKEYQGSKVGYTGMIWSGFRPSDDKQNYGYLIPSNAFAVVVLNQLAELADKVLSLPEMAAEAQDLQQQVLQGMETFGIVNTTGTPMLAYEVDGLGSVLLMDDANVPSLLSLSYLGFDDLLQQTQRKESSGIDWPAVLQATQDFVWSKWNPMYVNGTFAEGIGSTHTSSHFRPSVWHMSIVMKGLVAARQSPNNNKARDDMVSKLFSTLETTHANTFFMHESFDADAPEKFTRPWFAWSNSLFSELVIAHFDRLRQGDLRHVPPAAAQPKRQRHDHDHHHDHYHLDKIGLENKNQQIVELEKSLPEAVIENT